jgi:hypothetical protein
MGNSSKKVGFQIEFFSEFKAKCKTALARESGLYGRLIDEKTDSRKSGDPVL